MSNGPVKTGDQRVWEERYAEAMEALERGNNHRARTILKMIRKESPSSEMRKNASVALETLAVDPWFYVVWGVSAAVIVFIFVYYVVLR